MRGETSVYTQISPLKIRGKDEYILIFPGEKLVYTHFSGGKMSRGKNEYVTPDLPLRLGVPHLPTPQKKITMDFRSSHV